MPYPEELECWIEELSSAFPSLNSKQKEVLGLYSYGMAMTQRCGQTIVLAFLALLLKLKAENIRQRLKEFIYEAEAKRGKQRRELCLEALFAPLCAWLLQKYADKKKIVLAADVTYLKSRYMILCISLLYGQTAIPLAWKVLAGNEKGEWHPLWLELLASLALAIPCGSQVFVLFDRGLYSKRLFKAVRAYHWHPFMRIGEQGLYKRPKRKTWRSLKSLVKRGMPARAFKVVCFKGDPLLAYLWLQWEQDQDEACLLLSDLSPKQAKGNPYPWRMWIEASFKDWKRGGFRLEQCKTPEPERLARLLFVLSVAFVFLMRSANGFMQTSLLSPSNPLRRLSLLSLGWINSLVASIHDQVLQDAPFPPCLLPRFYPPPNTYP